MMIVRCFPVLLAGIALTTTVTAQVIHVPGDYATPQEAIDNAPAGATIRVEGTWESIVIDRPLTLIGPALFEGRWEWPTTVIAPIELAGPGHGTVVLSDISTGREYLNGSYLLSIPPGIAGGGFDALHVVDSEIRAPTCSFYGSWECYLHGEILGGAGIHTGDLRTIVIERSVVLGSSNGNDMNGGSAYDGPPGIDAPFSTVIALESLIGGGASDDLFWNFPCESVPCNPAGSDGAGGPAVVAAALYHSGTELRGGSGASWYGFEGYAYEYCGCSGPDGVPSITPAPPVELAPTLSLRPPVETGTALELEHTGPSGAYLYSAFGIRQPSVAVGIGGLTLRSGLFLKPPIQRLGQVSSGVVTVPIPQDPALIGREIAFQTYDLHSGLSRPVVGVIR